MNKKSVIPLIILIVILVAGAIAAMIVMKNIQNEQRSDELTPELTDEFTRIKEFITDWYNELRSQGECQIYLNEIRFKNGAYTLTFAKDRVRAVYPRGERFFKLEQVNGVEFFVSNGKLVCRLSYGRSGEYMFKIN